MGLVHLLRTFGFKKAQQSEKSKKTAEKRLVQKQLAEAKAVDEQNRKNEAVKRGLHEDSSWGEIMESLAPKNAKKK